MKRGFEKKVRIFFIFLTFFHFLIKKWCKYLQKWGECDKINPIIIPKRKERKNGTQRLHRYQN